MQAHAFVCPALSALDPAAKDKIGGGLRANIPGSFAKQLLNSNRARRTAAAIVRECLYVFSQAHNQTLEDTIVANAHRKYMVEINETRVAFAWNMLVVSQVALLPFRRTQ
ncbi:hypothetical protein H9P43_008171 [Blastocladiella emersonii ATCC 22665]|nr:hypothetical protein H9P43_008171 [Blastocladiella emersonii ATCC 22665]